MLDLKRTLDLSRGSLLDSEPTWRGYLPEAGDWKKTAIVLTVPLIVASAVVAYLLGLLGSGASLLGMFRPTLLSSIWNMIAGAIGICVFAFIYSALAGLFGGKNNFSLGFSAATLAFVPGYIGQALTWVPWIGGLLALCLGIYGLVLLWRITPIYLEVPEDKRVLHYVVTLLTAFVFMAIISGLLAAVVGTSQPYGGSTFEPTDSAPGGILGGAVRQANLLAEAEKDQFSAPSDGKLTDQQVQEFIRVMNRAAELQQQQADRLKEIADKANRNEGMSVSDFGQIIGGVQGLAGLQGGEVEVVKSAGGNWAEHQWVRASLRTAWLQKDINDTVKYNYALYEKHKDQLEKYVTQ